MGEVNATVTTILMSLADGYLVERTEFTTYVQADEDTSVQLLLLNHFNCEPIRKTHLSVILKAFLIVGTTILCTTYMYHLYIHQRY